MHITRLVRTRFPSAVNEENIVTHRSRIGGFWVGIAEEGEGGERRLVLSSDIGYGATRRSLRPSGKARVSLTRKSSSGSFADCMERPALASAR